METILGIPFLFFNSFTRSVLVKVFIVVTRLHDKNNLERRWFISSYSLFLLITTKSQSIFKGSQTKKSRQEPGDWN